MKWILLLVLSFTLNVQGAPLEQWVYVARNLAVDKNISDLEALFKRAAAAGYSHVLLADSKFARLGDMDIRYFTNIARVKQFAAQSKLEIVPAVFPVGYSNDLLWHDPNLIEALPARDALFIVKGGVARLASIPPVTLKGGDLSDFTKWDWKDMDVQPDDGAARIKDPKGNNARIVQKLHLEPFRQYHLSLRAKAQDFMGAFEVKLLVGSRGLNFNNLGVKRTQDWTTHHVVFNSLEHSDVTLYIGAWGARSGSVWFDDVKLEEVALVNLVRRPGAPLVVQIEGKHVLTEGKDYERVVDEKMGVKPWKGAYDIYHEPPVIKIKLPDGTRLRVSYYHAATVHDDQAMICPSEPRTVELLRDQAQRVHAKWGAKGYMMSHDEIRVLNWCLACQRRNLDAGAIIADNAKTCVNILREVNPRGTIYIWSDMFDPNHNAQKDYYLVRGDLKNSWLGLDTNVVIVNWNFGKRDQSLEWFAGRGHRQIIAGYYDDRPEQILQWLQSAKYTRGLTGVMYTTWQNKYADLERFAQLVRNRK
jgi:hypothetical protein